MNHQFDKLDNAINQLRNRIINHPVYSAITGLEDLQIFMSHHIYAVWDFMSLLKALQNSLTCTSVPWFPTDLPDIRYFINEIVIGEESDVDQNGDRKSHFEIYLEAMRQCGADVNQIITFLDTLRNEKSFTTAYAAVKTPDSVQYFVNQTFEVIRSNKPHIQASVFTYGREDLIPAMFHSIVNDLTNKFPNSMSVFKYYLERHIELDGDFHGKLASKMTEALCDDDDKRLEAKHFCVIALEARVHLWDGVLEEIQLRKNRNVVSHC